jgi:hypothetical protein
MWVGTWTLKSGTGGPLANPFSDRCSPVNGRIEERRARGFPRTWRTSVTGDIALGFDERALPGAARRSKNGGCRGGRSSGRVDLRVGYQVQPRHVPVEGW